MREKYVSEYSAKLERLYEKYKHVMFNEAYNILFDESEAEDAVQQAFVKIIGCVSRIDENNAAMTCNFLKVVTRNIAKDMYGKKFYLNTEDDASEKVDESFVHTTVSVPQMVITKELTSKVLKAISKLPDIYRDIILVEKVYGYTREESMKIFNESYETLKKRLTRARTKLMEMLKEDMQDDEEDNE